MGPGGSRRPLTSWRGENGKSWQQKRERRRIMEKRRPANMRQREAGHQPLMESLRWSGRPGPGLSSHHWVKVKNNTVHICSSSGGSILEVYGDPAASGASQGCLRSCSRRSRSLEPITVCGLRQDPECQHQTLLTHPQTNSNSQN